MIAFKIKEEIYDVPLIVTIGTWQDRSDYLNKHYDIEIGNQIAYGGHSELFINDGSAITNVWLPAFKINNVADIVTLIHEIDHVSFYILDLMNIPILDNSSNHAYIYLKEYLTKKALTKLKRLTNG